MGDSSNYDRTGDDFRSNYDFINLPRSSSEDCLARLDRLSSHGRIEDISTKSRKQAQQSLSAGPPMVYATADAPAYKIGMPKKEIDVDFQNSSAVSGVEGTMKKYADNLLRVLEGMNTRLSQLESSVFTLNHSMGDLKFSVADSYGKYDVSLRSLSNHFTDVQRAMQLLRDKQEIFETHAELVKLQLSKNDSVEDSKSGSSVAESQVSISSDSNFSSYAWSLSPQHGPSALAASQQPQSLRFNQATSSMFQESVAVPQTETFIQTKAQPSLLSSSSSVQPPLYFTGNADAQQAQPLQGLHPSTKHVLQMQSVLQQPQLQQSPFLPQQPLAPGQFHQPQQTHILQQSPQLPQTQVSQSMQLPLQHDQSVQQPSQPSLLVQSPKTHLQAQQGLLSETKMHQPEYYLSSQGAFEARPFASHSLNLPMPAAVYGASQLVVQPANVSPNEQYSQVVPQIYDDYHRVSPSVSAIRPVYDPQAGRYGI